MLKKLTKAIASAIEYLEASMKVASKGNDQEVSRPIWGAAADLEYALFLFSILQEESASSSWKLKSPSKDFEIHSFLTSARDLLTEAKTEIEQEELDEAHKKTWMARGYLLKLHNFFEKKQRKKKKAAKKSAG
ncbi:hypothetical protein GWN63_05310 [Candidatus Bathyarchaeota archaeon]|nr:hypothetical protein [Candidatus Bathyarchaeota archaeon]NIU81642.1 hypothetical protein [Candidatus Bathyarchaeota archaeon]NIV68454.1 hypothetical protein [Candidatus Bathyarchaeota archaeon]NIW16636.1 hypothetical protein [Candidatus Bathyarchaeota archaeon]NIW34830.1 hypothetical protein [Candidatus Bathyarchaeota archaeon]